MQRIHRLAVSCWALAIATIVAFAPNGMAPLLASGSLATLLFGTWRPAPSFLVKRLLWAPVLLLGLLLIWSLASIAWTVDQTTALTHWGKVLLVAVGGVIVAAAVNQAGRKRQDALLSVVTGACAIVAVLLSVDFLTDAALVRALRRLVGSDVTPHLGSYVHKNSGAILAIFSILGMAALIHRGRQWKAGGFLVLCLIGVWSSHGRAVTLAMAVGIAAWPLFFYFSGRMIVAVGGLLASAMVAFPLVVRTLPFPEVLLERFPAIGSSLGHRLLIWDFVAEKIAQRLLTGWGFDSSRALPDGAMIMQLKLPIEAIWAYPIQNLPLHPHNATLQIWLELGLPGGLLGAAICGAVFLTIARQVADRVTAAAMASAATTWWVIANVSYGIWQSWWQATTWIAVAVAVALYSPNEDLKSVIHGGGNA